MLKANLAIDAVSLCGVLQVAQDRGAVGDRLLAAPGPKAIAQRVHVGIRPHTGIAKQIPGAAKRVARLKKDEGFLRAVLLQMIRRADAGQTGADNDHIGMSGGINGLGGSRGGRCVRDRRLIGAQRHTIGGHSQPPLNEDPAFDRYALRLSRALCPHANTRRLARSVGDMECETWR
jgi:hypothetical protein